MLTDIDNNVFLYIPSSGGQHVLCDLVYCGDVAQDVLSGIPGILCLTI